MDVELTISGLCLLVLKSKDDEPKNPSAVDVICPAGSGHRVLVSYAPEDVITGIEPDLAVEPSGSRIASLAVSEQVMTLSFGASTEKEYAVEWGAASMSPAKESWLNWVPKLHELGLSDFKLGSPGNLPRGAAARLTLPFGRISARDVVKDPASGEYVVWAFPAVADLRRSVANQVVYRASGVKDFKLGFSAGGSLYVDRESGTLRISLSNDLAIVPKDYKNPAKTLEHLGHLAHLDSVSGAFKAPEIVSVQRTGKPICNQAVFVDKT